MTAEMDVLLLHLVLDSPNAMLKEITATIHLSTGKQVHLSTVCRAMRRLNLTRQRLQHYAVQRDLGAARQCWTEIMTYWRADQMLIVDESAKDTNVLRRSCGYGFRGNPPIAPDVAPLRDMRVSSLCLFTTDGFLDWRHTKGTFNRERFNAAMHQMLNPPGRPSPIATTPLVIIDNATIHHSDEFVGMVNALGGAVKFLSPYSWHLSPLDNKAFGFVVRYLQIHHLRLAQVPLETALDEAFTYSVDAAGARHCFHLCGYLYPFQPPT